jgi:Xaa-Pro aminopeptidase
MPSQSRIGIDPNVLSFQEATNLQKSLDDARRGVSLVAVKENIVDQIWSDKPAQPDEVIFRLDDKYTGASVASKLHRVREQLIKVGSPGVVVSQLDEVAWLFNLRGSDIPYNPVSLHLSRAMHLILC